MDFGIVKNASCLGQIFETVRTLRPRWPLSLDWKLSRSRLLLDMALLLYIDAAIVTDREKNRNCGIQLCQ